MRHLKSDNKATIELNYVNEDTTLPRKLLIHTLYLGVYLSSKVGHYNLAFSHF